MVRIISLRYLTSSKFLLALSRARYLSNHDFGWRFPIEWRPLPGPPPKISIQRDQAHIHGNVLDRHQ
jgi:hypothetical protein